MGWPSSLKRTDAFLAFAFIALGQAETWLGAGLVPRGPNAVLELLGAGAIAWRRRWPCQVAVGVGFVHVGQVAIGVDIEKAAVIFLCQMLMLYTVASREPLRRALPTGLIFALQLAAAMLIAQSGVDNLTFGIPLIAMAIGMGYVVQRRTAEAELAGVEAERSRRDNEETERAAVLAERARIARELHDVVSHSVSLMVIQASAAAEVLHTNPTRSAAALRVIEETGRGAISELAAMLGLLRDTGPELGLAPLPNLAQLPALVARACEVGGPVHLRTVGHVRPLPAGTELALYRVVQEALTNIHKHGDTDAPASVTIAYEPGEVVARVENSGRPVTTTGGGGHGLIGMRERVASLGGTLDARQRAEDGFVVTARIPTAS